MGKKRKKTKYLVKQNKSKQPSLSPNKPVTKTLCIDKLAKWPIIIFIGILSSVLTVIFFFKDEIKSHFTSPAAKFHEEKTVNGILDSIPYSNDSIPSGDRTETIPILLGTHLTLPDTIKPFPKVQGIYIPNFYNLDSIFVQLTPYINIVTHVSDYNYGFYPDFDSKLHCPGHLFDPPFKLLVRNGYLFISAEFRDLDNYYGGFISYNHWELYKSNILKFYNDANRLEVIDNSNNIMFSVRFEPPRTIMISGYFINKELTNIALFGSNGCGACNSLQDSGWKQHALKYITTLKSIFTDKEKAEQEKTIIN